MIKHIFCDLDGTLYQDGVSNIDVEAVNSLKDENIVFHIATGRVFKQSISMTRDYLVNTTGYYISENGSFIYDNDEKMIFTGTIDDNLVRKVIARFESNDAVMYFKYDGEVVLLKDHEIVSKFIKKYKVDEEFSNRETFKNLVGNIGIASSDIDELYRIELYMKQEFSEVLDVYFSAENVINLVPKGVSKRSSIKRVCEILGVEEDEIATMGDSPNDISMLEGIKYSFAMSHARKSVVDSANYKASSVADAIRQIVEINKK